MNDCCGIWTFYENDPYKKVEKLKQYKSEFISEIKMKDMRGVDVN
jgi:hypothetical protein